MKKRILIVDDFVNTRWVTEFTLKALNHELLTASNGKEALQFFDGRPVDLLITDYNMPVMNGGELVRAVRNKKNYIDIPIIVLSTEKSKEIIKAVEALEINGWIMKPFKTDEFIKLVKECLEL